MNAKLEVGRLTVPIVMVVSIVGATIFGMVEIGKVTSRLSENTIRLSVITDQVTLNTNTLREVVQTIQTNVEQRMTALEGRVEVQNTLFEAHCAENDRIKADIDQIESMVRELLRGPRP